MLRTWSSSRDLAYFLKAWSPSASMETLRTGACAGPQSPTRTQESLLGDGALPRDVEPF